MCCVHCVGGGCLFVILFHPAIVTCWVSRICSCVEFVLLVDFWFRDTFLKAVGQSVVTYRIISRIDSRLFACFIVLVNRDQLNFNRMLNESFEFSCNTSILFFTSI